jgi:hypothetical protein
LARFAAADIKRWNKAQGVPADVQEQLETMLDPDAIYINLAAFA